MTILNLTAQAPFTTKDGSTIRSILDRTNAPVQNQSLAEARVPAGGATQRHYHKLAEEFYFILEGTGEMEIDGRKSDRGSGRCDPHSTRRVAYDHGDRAVAISLLLRPAVCA